MTILAQIALDEAMMRLGPEEWRESIERRQIISQWHVRAIEDDDGAMAIVIRLGIAVQRAEIDRQAAFEVLRSIISSELRTIVKGEPHSSDVRAHALKMTRWIINDPPLRDDVFNLTVGLLESDDEDGLKFAAAAVLRQIEQVDAKQYASLVALITMPYSQRKLTCGMPR